MKLLDTSVLVENVRRGVPEPGSISIITLVEVLRGVRPEKRGRVKEAIEESFEVLSLSNEVVLKYCELYDRLRQRGVLLPDADLMIAATAMVNGLVLITKDRGFERLAEAGLRLEVRGG